MLIKITTISAVNCEPHTRHPVDISQNTTHAHTQSNDVLLLYVLFFLWSLADQIYRAQFVEFYARDFGTKDGVLTTTHK